MLKKSQSARSLLAATSRSTIDGHYFRKLFGTAEKDRKLTGQVLYERTKSEFNVSPDYRYEQLRFDGGSRFADTLTLVGDVGVESAFDEDTTVNGLDDDFWSAGLRREPGTRPVLMRVGGSDSSVIVTTWP